MPTAKKKKNIKKQTVQAKVKTSKAIPLSVKTHYRELIIIAVVTFLAYIPALRAAFVNWDDPDYVNEQVFRHISSSISNLVTTPIQGNYHPLTMLSLLLNHSISGMNPWSYHLLNLLLHLVNCFLVYRFILLLAKDNIIALVTAALFAIHPMHVESVAWVTERKDVLYGAFFIAGLISYVKYVDTGSRKQYFTTLIFLALALLSKPAAVIFPLALLCIDIFRKRGSVGKVLLEKIPFLVLPVIFGVVTYAAQKEKGAIDPLTFDTTTKALMGFYGIMMYFVKMIFPFNLAPFYPYWPINEALPKEYYVSPFFFIGLVVLCFYSWRRERVWAFGILFYLVNLLLVLQFLPVGSAIIADRYTYIPYIGLFFIVGWAISRFAKGKMSKAYVIMGPLMLILAVLTYRQATIWVDPATLWDHTIEVAPGSKAYTNRADLFATEKNYDKALEYFTEALKLNAIDKEAYTNRGNVYFDTGKYDLAFADYRHALAIDSNYYTALDNFGALYSLRGQFDSGLIHLNRAITLKPDYAPPYKNRALTFMSLKQYPNAIKDFETFLIYHPDDPDIINIIGVCYRFEGKYQEALTTINKALSIKPDPHFYLDRSYCYRALNNMNQARQDALVAKKAGIPIDPPFAKELGIE